MGRTILAIDIVAIGLIVSEGDIDLNLEELLTRIRNYEVDHGIEFIGWNGDDLESSISNLLYLHFDFRCFDTEHLEYYYKRFVFKDLIPQILNFHSFYVSDTDDGWETFDMHNEKTHEIVFNYCSFDFGDYNEFRRNRYEFKMRLHNALVEFIKVEGVKKADILREFFVPDGITPLIIKEISVPKKWSKLV